MTKLNLASGVYTMRGFDNLDPCHDGRRFQDGLPFYDDNSVEAVTCSHGISQLPLADWPALFAEIHRVLEPGGVARFQDEWADNPESAHYPHGFPGVATLTTPALVVEHMRAAGLDVARVDADTTTFRDRSLIQHLHAGEPHSFSIEGVKPR